MFYEEKNVSSSLKQIQHMGKHDPWFHHFFHAGRFREVAERLLHGPVVPKNMQYFNKPPRIGLPTPPHQDGFYFMLNPCEAVTMWFALEEVDEDNGCVRYVKGSHKQGMRKHARTQTLGFSQGIVDYPRQADRENELALPANAGGPPGARLTDDSSSGRQPIPPPDTAGTGVHPITVNELTKMSRLTRNIKKSWLKKCA